MKIQASKRSVWRKFGKSEITFAKGQLIEVGKDITKEQAELMITLGYAVEILDAQPIVKDEKTKVANKDSKIAPAKFDYEKVQGELKDLTKDEIRDYADKVGLKIDPTRFNKGKMIDEILSHLKAIEKNGGN